MKKICAFSSDSRELYKADIYRALALPNDHVIHFRYKRKYVDDNLFEDLNSLRNKEVIIFFNHKDCDNSTDASNINTSIRKACICEVINSHETGLIHVYMKLTNFCNIVIDSGNSVEKMPGTKFFSELDCTETNSENDWNSRILKVYKNFPDLMFFYLKEIKKLKIHFSENEKSSFYKLSQGRKYILSLSLANPNNTSSKIEISDSNKEIMINCINPLESSAQFDDLDVSIATKTLQVNKQSSFLSFKPLQKDKELGEYMTNIELSSQLSLWNASIFGGFATVLGWATLLIKDWPKVDNSNLWISSFLFFIATSSLFYFYNKK